MFSRTPACVNACSGSSVFAIADVAWPRLCLLCCAAAPSHPPATAPTPLPGARPKPLAAPSAAARLVVNRFLVVVQSDTEAQKLGARCSSALEKRSARHTLRVDRCAARVNAIVENVVTC